MAKLPPFPLRNPLTVVNGYVSTLWRDWFTALRDLLNTAPARVFSTHLTAQNTSLTTTTALTVPETGIYRLSYTARITQAATVSSSLTVTLGWTDTGVACSQAGAAMTGNTTTTVQSGSVVVYADAGSPVTYSTTRASVGATSMTYALAVLIEQVP